MVLIMSLGYDKFELVDAGTQRDPFAKRIMRMRAGLLDVATVDNLLKDETPTGVYPKDEITMSQPYYTPYDQDVGNAIGKAIVHAQGVARREHIKADRIERVNQFTVSLRHELRFVTPVPSALLEKELWQDIGVYNAAYPTYKAQPDRAALHRWLQLASAYVRNQDRSVEEIRHNLQELEVYVSAGLHCVADAERINEESSHVADSLSKLVA